MKLKEIEKGTLILVDFKQEDENVWTSANGDIKISDMETNHIRNVLDMINDMIDKCKIDDYPIQYETLFNELANRGYKTDDELDYMKNFLMSNKFVNQRVALRQHYQTHAGLKRFTTKLKKAFDEAQALPKLKGGRSAPAEISRNDIEKFALLYNTKNPFLNKQIKNIIGENNFTSLQRRGQTLGLINKNTIKFNQDIAGAVLDSGPMFDQATMRAANILKRYKELVPLTSGSELRLGTYNFGYIDTIKLFETDPFLKAYINAPSRQGGSTTGAIFSDQVKGAEDIIKR